MCSVQFFVTLWTVAPYQALLSMEFPRQEYWSGLPFPSPGDLLDQGIELASPESSALAGRFFTIEPMRPGSISRSERSPGEGNGNTLQYSCLGNYMDRGA